MSLSVTQLEPGPADACPRRPAGRAPAWRTPGRARWHGTAVDERVRRGPGRRAPTLVDRGGRADGIG
jgi:hypothetical protein